MGRHKPGKPRREHAPVPDCKTAGVHRLPDGEDSWGREACDVLVAACLDGCVGCQATWTREICDRYGEDFGQLFTTWVMTTLHRNIKIGRMLPATGLDLFGPAAVDIMSEPSSTALQGVRIVSTMPGAYTLDTAAASAALAAMTAADRRAVLDDVLDGITGDIQFKGVDLEGMIGAILTRGPGQGL